ncbi:GNAT family N-acetyltransferase [Hanstruepera neustonica]|uniref:GNAT family N-acetyltransferase n=2 Tax=Hanstruepera neustonica TaxID=1445657 RepID=A0A2K1E384_9FLAO|nr:GNAT family N-acetyltransferase [Hanstruepera neustonica]
MEDNDIKYHTIEGLPKNDLLDEILCLYQDIFSDADSKFFIERIQQELNVFSVLAFNNGKLIGFKIGYPKNQEIFYSWIGGVKTQYRSQGVGKTLAELQEVHAKHFGFQKLQTKSMNRFKPMMILNLKNGFNITKVYTNEKGQTKIVFEKDLI